jgi:hypothetical protein
MGWMIGVLGFNTHQGLGIFLFTTASRMTVGSNGYKGLFLWG